MNELERLRKEIDNLDKIIVSAYVERLNVVKSIGEYKKNNNVKVLDSNRENEVLKKVCENAGEYKDDVINLYKYIMDYSKKKQSER